MALPFPSDTRLPTGKVELQYLDYKTYRAFFTPPAEALPNSWNKEKEFKYPIFEVDLEEKSLVLYPYQVGGVRTMKPRYIVLSVITMELNNFELASLIEDKNVEGFLYTVLPEAFIEDINYGIGFKKGYRSIITFLESFGIQQLQIKLNGDLSLDVENKKATISRRDLNKMTKSINTMNARIQRVALRFKKELVSDMFLGLLDPKKTNTQTEKMTTATIEDVLQQGLLTKKIVNKEARTDAIRIVNQESRQIARENPEALIRLRQDIELVTLEELINRFEAMMSQKLTETHWQKLLNQNPFILNMAFGIPVMKVEDQATMGGTKFSGRGGKIADFLVQNSLSGNAAIVEIKTPSMKLLSKTAYRNGMFGPSAEIANAVSQMLDQIYMFQKDFNSIKVNSRNHTIESFSVSGILIAGKSLIHSDEQKSFELFRGNSKNVQVITFDELLGKLKELYQLLSPQLSATSIQDNRLPKEDSSLPF